MQKGFFQSNLVLLRISVLIRKVKSLKVHCLCYGQNRFSLVLNIFIHSVVMTGHKVIRRSRLKKWFQDNVRDLLPGRPMRFTKFVFKSHGDGIKNAQNRLTSIVNRPLAFSNSVWSTQYFENSSPTPFFNYQMHPIPFSFRLNFKYLPTQRFTDGYELAWNQQFHAYSWGRLLVFGF